MNLTSSLINTIHRREIWVEERARLNLHAILVRIGVHYLQQRRVELQMHFSAEQISHVLDVNVHLRRGPYRHLAA